MDLLQILYSKALQIPFRWLLGQARLWIRTGTASNLGMLDRDRLVRPNGADHREMSFSTAEKPGFASAAGPRRASARLGKRNALLIFPSFHLSFLN